MLIYSCKCFNSANTAFVIFHLHSFFVPFIIVFVHPFSHAAFQFHVISSSIQVTNTFMMGVAPAASSGSACRMERKVSEPSKPRPDRKAPMTGITDSSKSSQRTKPCRYCSLNALTNTQQLISSSLITAWFKKKS